MNSQKITECNKKQKEESSKSRAWCACMLACFACLRAYVLTCFACLRAYVLGMLACLRAWRACVLTCLRVWQLACLRASVFVCLACLRAWHDCVLTCLVWLRACVRGCYDEMFHFLTCLWTLCLVYFFVLFALHFNTKKFLEQTNCVLC